MRKADAADEAGPETAEGGSGRTGGRPVDKPLSRDEILAYYARTGYSLEHHPAHVIRRAHQRATAYFQETIGAASDLTPTQLAVLATLLKHGELSQNLLGRLTAMDPSTVSIVVRALLKRGFLDRRPSDTDQRMSIITLTEAGVRCGLENLDRSVDIGRRLLAPLSTVEQAMLLDFLNRICADED
ncbi:MarR family transcriptional regulator [Aureimonas endophytica]|uniref:MarR family transcriptional regulator n=1 Tax=Aureimonas endophytica TaxID=2027858 RepID=A0A916ZRN3_9HYPH|nr:MarR family transcriptional regulator [Aureimonas endophytica]GGE10801.1 MarR family transcriptional regulator [Aureimonas endophytica]